jgi:hypothetical protein
MADLRTEQQITREIENQYSALEKIKGSTKEGIALKKRIVQLETELGITQAQNAKKENEQQKEIQKQIDARIKKVRALNGIESAQSKVKQLQVKAQNETLQLLKKEAGMKGGLTTIMREQQMVTEDIGTGVNDASGLLVLQAQSAARINKSKDREELINRKIQQAMENGRVSLAEQLELKRQQAISEQDIEGSVSDNLGTELKGIRVQHLKKKGLETADKLSGGMVSKAKQFGNDMGMSPKNLAKLGVAGLVVGLLVKAATGFSKKIDAVGETFGFMTNKNKEFRNDLIDSGNEAMMVGKNLGDVLAVTSQLSSEFGISLKESQDIAGSVLDTAVATGISNDEATKLFGTFMKIGGLTSDQAENLIESTAQLAAQSGVAPKAVLQDMAGSAEEIAGFTKDGGENIAEAAVQARQMGMSLSTTAKIAEGLLDFESSISNEIEASVMIGKQLNFQRARQLALEGDIAGATKNIVDQVGSEAEFNKLNYLQRKSLAKSIGVSVVEMKKLISAGDKLTLSGALAGKNFDDLVGQDALSGLTSIINSLKMVGAALMDEIGKPIAEMLKSFQTSVMTPEGMKEFKNKIIGVVNSIIGLINGIGNIVDAFMWGDQIKSIAKMAVPKAQTSISGFSGGEIMVGESGPERVSLPRGSNVTGAEQTRQMAQQQQSSGLTQADAEMIGNAMASKISLKTDVSSGNLQLAMNSSVNPPAGTPLIRDFS